MTEPGICGPLQLPLDRVAIAAQRVRDLPKGPTSPAERLRAADPVLRQMPTRLAVVADKMWPTAGVRLSVGFFDTPDAALRQRIIGHLNAWGLHADIVFTESDTDPDVRIAREAAHPFGLYWSFVGTDILGIADDQPTMNLGGFTMATADTEFFRVVRHEAGHTLGFPHEHMRRALVARIDPDRAKAFYKRTNGWSPAKVQAQVLTPIEENSVRGTLHADPNSIMCYQIPGEITVDGVPIPGGTDINAADHAFAAICYPR